MAEPLARSPAVYDLTLELRVQTLNHDGKLAPTTLRRVIRARDPDRYLQASFGLSMQECCASSRERGGVVYATPSRQWVPVPDHGGLVGAELRLLGFERHMRGSYAYQWVSETHWASMTPADGVVAKEELGDLGARVSPDADPEADPVAEDVTADAPLDVRRFWAWASLRAQADTAPGRMMVRRGLPPLLAESALWAYEAAGPLTVLEDHVFDGKPTLPVEWRPVMGAWRFALRSGPRAQDSDDPDFVWWAFVTSILSKSVASDVLYHFEDRVLETYVDGVHLACKDGGSSVVIRGVPADDGRLSWTFQIIGPMGDAAAARGIRGLDVYDIAQLVGVAVR